MSTTTIEVKAERANDIRLALEGRDAELLRYFAELEKQEGNDEYAEALLQSANRLSV